MPVRRVAVILSLAVVLAGCSSGGGVSPSDESSPSETVVAAEPIPRRVGPADDGALFTMEIDETTTLRLPASDTSEPQLEGTSALLIEQVNVDAADGREWEVRAVEPGRSVIRGDEWEITLEVEAAG
ncbi:hypothetical protein GCM10022200_14560 [Microbacterium awajiense]|uniref:Uncharacterized protein n=1 Tax=Microbacterium awajiense TaxID=415214 RepID=A0ABP7AII0_9MICO